MMIPEEFKDCVSYNEDKNIFIIKVCTSEISIHNIEDLVKSDIFKFYISIIERYRVLIDLEEVTFIDSTGIGTLINKHVTSELKYPINLCNISSSLSRLLKIINISPFIPYNIHLTVADCLLSLESSLLIEPFQIEQVGRRKVNGNYSPELIYYVKEVRALIVSFQENKVVMESIPDILNSSLYKYVLDSTTIDHLILDLINVEVTDSSAVGALITTYVALRKKDISISLCNIKSNIKKVLDLTCILDAIDITIKKDVQECLKYLKNNKKELDEKNGS